MFEVVEKNDDYKKSTVKWFGLGKVWPYIKRYKKTFLIATIGSMIAGALTSIIYLFQQYAIDNFVIGGSLSALPWFIITYLATVLLLVVTDYNAVYAVCRNEMFVLRDLRRTAFNHLQTISVSYFNQMSVGRLHARVMSDTSNISSIVAWDSYQLIFSLVSAVTAVVIMVVLNPLLALCVLALIPITAIVSAYFERILTKQNRRVREINSVITGGINEGITGAETSKTLSVESSLDKDFTARTRSMRKESNRMGHYRALLYSIMMFISSVAIAAVLWYGGVLSEKGVILIGTLSIFLSYAQRISDTVQWIVELFSDLITVRVNVERFTSLCESTGDVQDKAEVIEKYGDCFNEKRENWEKLNGDIEFKDITFKYPDGDEYVLEHFNLKVPKGTNVAIVGETGAGKSTLVNLVCRFFEPTEGQVLIDGVDARERSVNWLHSNIGYVLQTPHLFSGTIRENLLYGKEDATEEEIDAVIKSVNADRIIERMEKGYDTLIGEGGNSLSTGEKQLLSFARALLVDPAIFVLDEATSSIDTLTEKLIQEAIEKVMEGRTSFVIAHRLSTIRSADIILVIDDGKIVERGTHEQLLKQHGVYYNLYLKQFREEQMKAENL